jgi:hypothetical protein
MSQGPQRLLFAVIAFCCSACGIITCATETPKPPPKPGSFTYQLSCDTIIGDVKTWVTYTVKASAEPVASGQEVTYAINAPIAKVNAGVTPRFQSSTITFDVPDGLAVESVSSAPTADTPDIKTAEAHLDNGQILFTVTGDFDLDDTPRPVPDVTVLAKITAATGGTVSWMAPVRVVGHANAGIFGDQTTTCHFEQTGSIWVSHVVDGD